MIGDLFAVMMETPILMIIFVVDLTLIFAILFYVGKKIYNKKRPDQSIVAFLTSFKLKRKIGAVSTIETLYDYIIRTYAGRGVISKSKFGYGARKKILKHIQTKKKPAEFEVVESIFKGFEMKKYGGGIYNENAVVNSLFTRFKHL